MQEPDTERDAGASRGGPSVPAGRRAALALGVGVLGIALVASIWLTPDTIGGAVRVFVDAFINLDEHLAVFLEQYGAWVYALLFLIVFAETGLVVTPLLPGDSLLFVAGTLAASGGMEVVRLIALLILAAVLGDAVNYHIGRWVGPKVFTEGSRFLRRRHLERTHAFYEKHGGKTIVLARFMPIIRTFAPFVAGVGTMPYQRFAIYNVAGGTAWVVAFVLAGYFFGNIPQVEENLSLVILGIVVLSVLPGVVAWARSRRRPAD